jgi:hypothetical protein
LDANAQGQGTIAALITVVNAALSGLSRAGLAVQGLATGGVGLTRS